MHRPAFLIPLGLAVLAPLAAETVVKTYGDGTVQERYEVVDDQRHGPFQSFHPDGRPAFTATYAAGSLVGPFTTFHPNGSVHRSGLFVAGNLSGSWKEYDPEGVLRVEGTAAGSRYAPNNPNDPIRDGTWTWYHANGQIAYRCDFSGDRATGAFTAFFPNGKVHRSGSFADGQLVGPWKEFDDQGTLRAEGEAAGCRYTESNPNDPIHTGDWVWYHANGTPSLRITYVNDQAAGPFSSFHANGQLERRGTFAAGIGPVGTWEEFDDQGILRISGKSKGSRYNTNSTKDPLFEGEWIWYHANGERSFVGSYVNGEPVGAFASFHANGKLRRIGTFQAGGGLIGLWQDFRPDGTLYAEGHAVGSRYVASSPDDPIGHGPWIWRHPNGIVSQRGSYDHGKRVGIWYRYNEAGVLIEAKHAEQEGETTFASSTDPSTGTTTSTVRHPDGAITTLVTDQDGAVIEESHRPAHGKGGASASSTDRATGITTTVSTDAAGNRTVSTSWIETDGSGQPVVVTERSDGTREEAVQHADGRRSVRLVRPDGSTVTTTRTRNGAVHRRERMADGSLIDQVTEANGSEHIVRTDADGVVVEEIDREPGGRERQTRADGLIITREPMPDGASRETRTAPDGATTVTLRDGDGRIIDRRRGGTAVDPQTPIEAARIVVEERERAEAARHAEADAQRRTTAEAALKQADDRLADPPPSRIEPQKAPDPTKSVAEDLTRTEARVKWLSTFLEKLPQAQLTQFQNELAAAMKHDPALVKELLSTDRAGLAGFLNRHPEVMNTFEATVLPTLKRGTSAVGAYLSFQKGMLSIDKGDYAQASMDFLDAGTAGLGALPEETLRKLERRLQSNLAPSAALLKNIIGFTRELSRAKTPDQPLNHGTLLKEVVGMIANGWQGLPEAQRNHLLTRLLGNVQRMEALNKAGPVAKRIIGFLEAAPEAYALYTHWGTGKAYPAIAKLAQKLGPKGVGALIYAQTRNEAAAEVAEFLAQLGADYLGRLGDDIQRAGIAAMQSHDQAAAIHLKHLTELRTRAAAIGLNEEEIRRFEAMSESIGGHWTRIALSDLQRRGGAEACRQAMAAITQAWAWNGNRFPAIGTALATASGAPWTEGLITSEDAAQVAARRAYLAEQADTARILAEVIDVLLVDYPDGSAGKAVLAAYRRDCRDLARAFAP